MLVKNLRWFEAKLKDTQLFGHKILHPQYFWQIWMEMPFISEKMLIEKLKIKTTTMSGENCTGMRAKLSEQLKSGIYLKETQTHLRIDTHND